MHAGGSDAGNRLQVFEAARAMFVADVPSFVAACCELLRPESNCSLDMRMQALLGGFCVSFVHHRADWAQGTCSPDCSLAWGVLVSAAGERPDPRRSSSRTFAIVLFWRNWRSQAAQ